MFWSAETIQLTPDEILPVTGFCYMSTYIVTDTAIRIQHIPGRDYCVYQYVTRVLCKRNDSVQS